MSGLTCVKCKQPGDRLAAPPFPNDLGTRIFDDVCERCWKEWLKEQTTLINHYALNLLDIKAKKFLTEQTEAFLFGADSTS